MRTVVLAASLAVLPMDLSAQDCDTVAAVTLEGGGSSGLQTTPRLRGVGAPLVDTPYHLRLGGAAPQSPGIALASLSEGALPFLEGTLLLGAPFVATQGFAVDATGGADGLFPLSAVASELCGLEVLLQTVVLDAGAPAGAVLSNALRVRFGIGRTPLFSHPRHEAGAGAWSVAVADLDADGALDIVSANEDDNTVSVALGAGDLSFANTLHFPVLGDAPRHVEVVDVNGDGLLDLLTANAGSDDISVLRGNGDGTFQAATLTPVGEGPEFIAPADFDGDGDVDIAVSNRAAQTVTILQGTGTGDFAHPVDHLTGPFPRAMRVVDFNSDGNLDLLVGHGAYLFISVLLGDGTGTLTAETEGMFMPVAYVLDLEWIDFNEDGVRDLVMAHEDLGVGIRIGLGDGAFAPIAYHPVATVGTELSAVRSIEVIDIDGDGTLDIFARVTDPERLVVLRGLGAGQLAQPEILATGRKPSDCALADLDGDGALDATCVGSKHHDAWIHRGLHGGTFRPLQNYPLARPLWVDATDLDGDGQIDLVSVSGEDDVLAIWRGDGTGDFLAPAFVPTGDNTNAGIVGDWNGDGAPDIAVGSGPDQQSWELFGNAGDGTFFSVSSGSVQEGAARLLAGGDFNGDGHADLATSGHLLVEVLAGDGHFGLSPMHQISQSEWGAGQALISADIDGDGALDVVAGANSALSLAVHFGAGDGSFDPLPHTRFAGNYVTHALARDFDADGYLDVVATVHLEHSIALLRGDGNGTLKPRRVFPAGNGPVSATAADFDGDGLLDLAVGDHGNANGFSSHVSWLKGSSAGTFGPPRAFLTDGDPGWLDAADIDQDGVQDLVVANISCGTCSGFDVDAGLTVLPNLVLAD